MLALLFFIAAAVLGFVGAFGIATARLTAAAVGCVGAGMAVGGLGLD